jgi:hypothetical protein
MDELAKYYRIWKKLLLGDAWEGGEHQYVFHSGKGKPYYYTTPTARWTKIKKKYGSKMFVSMTCGILWWLSLGKLAKVSVLFKEELGMPALEQLVIFMVMLPRNSKIAQ